MKKYNVIMSLMFISLGAFFGHNDNGRVSIENKLTVVFAYHPADKKDKVGKENIRELQKAFNSFKNDRSYKKIGVAMMSVNLSEDSTFVDRYLDKEIEGTEQSILFFKQGALLKDETLVPSSSKELTRLLEEKLHSEDSKIYELMQAMHDEYKEKKEKEDAQARAASLSIMYPSVWNYFDGYYSPYYPRSYWGFGVGFGGWRHRHW